MKLTVRENADFAPVTNSLRGPDDAPSQAPPRPALSLLEHILYKQNFCVNELTKFIKKSEKIHICSFDTTLSLSLSLYIYIYIYNLKIKFIGTKEQ
jgi:hypothetical protein